MIKIEIETGEDISKYNLQHCSCNAKSYDQHTYHVSICLNKDPTAYRQFSTMRLGTTANCQLCVISNFQYIINKQYSKEQIINGLREAYRLLYTRPSDVGIYKGVRTDLNMKLLFFDVHDIHKERIESLFGETLLNCAKYTSTNNSKMYAGFIDFTKIEKYSSFDKKA